MVRKEEKEKREKSRRIKGERGDGGIKMRWGELVERAEGTEGKDETVAERKNMAGQRTEGRKGRGHCGAEAADVSHRTLHCALTATRWSPVRRTAKQLPLQSQSPKEGKKLNKTMPKCNLKMLQE